MTDNYKPCEVPCPKCGSQDILRHFYRKGEDTHVPLGGKIGRSTLRVDRADRFRWPALEDVIVNHCRDCQFDWDSKPLE